MTTLDAAFLAEVGLGDLPEEEKVSMLEHIYETLETRVGHQMAQGMTEVQLDAFHRLMQAQDEDGALKWLGENCPDYRQVVSAQLASLKAEIAANADAILAASEGASPAAAPGVDR